MKKSSNSVFAPLIVPPKCNLIIHSEAAVFFDIGLSLVVYIVP